MKPSLGTPRFFVELCHSGVIYECINLDKYISITRSNYFAIAALFINLAW